MMTTKSEEPDKINAAEQAEADHDAYIRAKVRIGLEQSRDRSKMIPLEQVWRNLAR